MVSETRISFLLNNLVREMNGQADSLLRSRFKMTYSQYIFLLHIGASNDIDVTRLANSLGVTKGAVSKRMSWFEERQLVAVNHFPGDSKRVLVALTDQGSALVRSAGDYLEGALLEAISKAPEVDHEFLRSELQKIFSLLLAKRQTD